MQPPFLHSHCVCHLFTLSIPSSLHPSPLHSVHPSYRGSSEHSRPGLVKPMCFSGTAKAGEAPRAQTHPSCLSAGTATLPVGQPTTLSVDSSVEAENPECSVLPCPHNGGRCGTSWNMLPNYEPLTQTGAPGTTPPQGHLAQVYRELLREPQHTLHG